jgi:PAS domain S-box-containing protein
MAGSSRDLEDASALAARLQAAATRLHTAAGTVMRGGADPPVLSVEYLTDAIAADMEELSVAQEEILAQAEQLAGSLQAIDAERERYAALFEFAPDPYVETDRMGKILEANTAASELLGVPPRFLPGKLLQSFIAVEDRARVRHRLRVLREGIDEGDLRAEVAPRSGAPRTVAIRLGTGRRTSEDQASVLWMIRDETEQCRLEQELGALRSAVDLLMALTDVNRLVESDAPRLPVVLQQLVELGAGVGLGAAIVLFGPRPPAVRAHAECGAAAGEACRELLRLEGERRLLRTEDLDDWPSVREIALRQGAQGVAVAPIVIDGETAGSFLLFTRGDGTDPEAMARLLSQQASAAISNVELFTSARQLASQLVAALDSRGVIEQAKGILIAAQGCTPDEAFDMLRRASQRQSQKLRVIAEAIVTRAVAAKPAAEGPTTRRRV